MKKAATTRLGILRGGLYGLKIYQGILPDGQTRTVVAHNSNEAYALLLDALYEQDTSGIEIEKETDEHIITCYKYCRSGVYNPKI